MSDRVVIWELKPLSEVTRVYSGRPGCACGCRGTYYSKNAEIARDKGYWIDEDEANEKDGWRKSNQMIKRVYKLFEKNLSSGKVYSWESSKNDFVCLSTSENRTYTMYYI